MEKKVYILGGVLLAIVLIVVVLTLYSPSSVPSEVLLTDTDNGNEIAVRKGQSLVISLDSNPTTGYTWELVE
ncbi:inhibitor of cysteine peptidase [Candidatus Methanophagaceae archaeon]|nr:inhibitor of cysteine peptidase [Methanophagales archaeon]